MGLIEWIKWLFGRRTGKSEVLVNTEAVEDVKIPDVREVQLTAESADLPVETEESSIQEPAEQELDFNSLMDDYFVLREKISDTVRSAKKMQKQGEYKDVFEMLSEMLGSLNEVSECLEKSISTAVNSDVKEKLNELLTQIKDAHTSLLEFESESPNIGDAKTIVSILDTMVTDLDTAESTELQELLAVN